MESFQTDSWQALEPDCKPGIKKVPVRFGVSQSRGTGPRRGRILLLRDIVDQLGLSTWRVDAILGKGVHEGDLAITGSKDGRFELQKMGKTKGGGTFRLSLPVIGSWTEYDCPMGEIDHRFETVRGGRKALILTLPAPLVSQQAFKKWSDARRGL